MLTALGVFEPLFWCLGLTRRTVTRRLGEMHNSGYKLCTFVHNHVTIWESIKSDEPSTLAMPGRCKPWIRYTTKRAFEGKNVVTAVKSFLICHFSLLPD